MKLGKGEVSGKAEGKTDPPQKGVKSLPKTPALPEKIRPQTPTLATQCLTQKHNLPNYLKRLMTLLMSHNKDMRHLWANSLSTRIVFPNLMLKTR